MSNPVPVKYRKADVVRITAEGIYVEFWPAGKRHPLSDTQLLLSDGVLKRVSGNGHHSLDNPPHPSQSMNKINARDTERFIDAIGAHIVNEPGLGKTAIHDMITHLMQWQETRDSQPDLANITDQIESRGMMGGNWVHDTVTLLEPKTYDVDKNPQEAAKQAEKDKAATQAFLDEHYPISPFVRKKQQLLAPFSNASMVSGLDGKQPLYEGSSQQSR